MEVKFNASQSHTKTEFLEDLKNYKHPKLATLHKLLVDSKDAKKLKISVAECITPDIRQHFVVMVSGYNDTLLVKLGSMPYAFPRGFPILWVPKERMQLFGFLPKFENDSRQEVMSPKDFDGYTDQCNFFRKWSGFLGQAFAYELDGRLCWTATTKNSAYYSSPFVEEAHNLLRPYFTESTCSKLVEQRLHLCAELMSQRDQTHGARVLNSSVVVTAVCRGVQAILKGSKEGVMDHDKRSNFKEEVVDNDSPHRFVAPLTHEQVVATCQVLGLPVDSSVSINGAENVTAFLEYIAQNRDFMTDRGLDTAIASVGSGVQVVQGSVCHQDVLGDVLEGIVLHLQGPKGSRILKLKFPNYTCRTMCLRSMLERQGDEAPEREASPGLSSSSGAGLAPLMARGADRGVPPPSVARRSIQSWARAWCVSEQGREHWKKVLWAAYSAIAENRVVDDNSGAALHIRALDQVSPTAPPQTSHKDDGYDGTVIVVVGPIGYGKSTVAERIAEHLNTTAAPVAAAGAAAAVPAAATGTDAVMHEAEEEEEDTAGSVFGDSRPRSAAAQPAAAAAAAPLLSPVASQSSQGGASRGGKKQGRGRGGSVGSRSQGPAGSRSEASAGPSAARGPGTATPGAVAEHIDGDLLGLDSETVLKLGQERQDYTLWQVHKALMAGRIPVISTGGGVLFGSNNKNLVLRSAIDKAFGADVKLVVVAPTDALEAYEDSDTVARTIEWRLQHRIWPAPPGKQKDFVDMIAKKSVANLQFCEQLVREADVVVRYDRLTTAAPLNPAVLDDVRKVVEPLNTTRFAKGSFKQQRLLVRTIDGMKHVTLRYEASGFGWDLQQQATKETETVKVYMGRRVEATELEEEEGAAGASTSGAPAQRAPQGRQKKGKGEQVATGEQGASSSGAGGSGGAPAKSSKPRKAAKVSAIVVDMPGLDVAHVTMNPGPHLPMHMRTLTAAMQQGKPQVTLPAEARNGEPASDRTYGLPKLEHCREERVDGISVFCIA